jgi:hypothetical protein
MRSHSRRAFLASTAALSTTALAGCMGGADGETGTLATSVSDQPGDIADFEECVVTIEEIRLQPSDADTPATDETAAASELVTIDVDGATADLVDLQGDDSALVDESDVETGQYEWLQLAVSAVDATLAEDGSDADVQTPGDAPLKFNASFEIRAETTTSFTADFTPVTRGQSGGYVLQPVADEVVVTYSDDTTPSDSPTETTPSDT